MIAVNNTEEQSESEAATTTIPCVKRLHQVDRQAVIDLLASFSLSVEIVDSGAVIPGSHWGDDEAGLIGNTLYARLDTPVHSVMHEACHWILMDEQRRETLHTDAGGTSLEENAVCYLQILLAEELPDMTPTSMCADMDQWGYSFRLGSAAAWFMHDAEDARHFLAERGLRCHLKQPLSLTETGNE